MKRYALFCVAFLLVCLVFPAHGEDFLQGSVLIHGEEIMLDALWEGNVPDQLFIIQLVPSKLTPKQVDAAVRQFFTPAPTLQRSTSIYPKCLFDYYAHGSHFSQYFCPDHRLLVPEISDGLLRQEVANCKAFLDALDIGYAAIPTCAAYGNLWRPAVPEEAVDSPTEYYIKLALEVEGLPIAQTGDRGSLDGIRQDDVMLEWPYAEFGFDKDGQLVRMAFPSFVIKSVKPAEGTLIPWQDALAQWWEECFTDYWGQKFMEEFRVDHQIVVVRIQFCWLRSFSNQLRPGWYFEMRSQNRHTGEVVDATWSMAGMDAMR